MGFGDWVNQVVIAVFHRFFRALDAPQHFEAIFASSLPPTTKMSGSVRQTVPITPVTAPTASFAVQWVDGAMDGITEIITDEKLDIRLKYYTAHRIVQVINGTDPYVQMQELMWAYMVMLVYRIQSWAVTGANDLKCM